MEPTTKRDQSYWLFPVMRESLYEVFGGNEKEIAQALVLAPDENQPDWSVVMDAVLGLLRVDHNPETAYSFGNIRLTYLSRPARDKLAAPQWSGKDLKMWVISRSKDQ